MQNENKRALVVDLSYQVHRYLSVPQMSELRNKDKVKVGGVFGVLKALNNALSNDCFSKVICCMDSYPAYRKQLFPSYKSSRRNNPDSPEYASYIATDKWGWSQKSTQEFTFRTLKFLLPKLKIKTIIQENVEGDDLVYHTCKHLTEQGWSCTAMSDDKDYLQLVNLIPGIKILRAMHGDVVTSLNFFDKCKVYPEWFIFYKALLGDPSDEIPNVVKGFGEASIIKFVNKAHELRIDPNDLNMYDKLFSLAENWEDSRSKRSIQKFTKDCLQLLEKNLNLMDFRRCPYGSNKHEELKSLLNESVVADESGAIELLEKLEMKTMMALPYSPIIKRLT